MDMEFLLLGDQSTEAFTALRLLASLEPVAHDFLAQLDQAIRREVFLLSRTDKNRLPELPPQGQSLVQAWAKTGSHHPVLRPVLTATSQCIDLLSYASRNKDKPRANQLYCLGTCTGLLTAAVATALSACHHEWVSLAVRVVCIALRIGLVTAATRECLTADDDSRDTSSWSSVVRGDFPSTLLDEFHKDQAIPVPQQAYISAITPSSKTISGPPHTLRRLFDSAPFKVSGCSATALPISAPYHAPHLYTDDEAISWVLGADDPATLSTLGNFPPRATLLSTVDGKPLVAADMVALLTLSVREILRDVLRWDKVLAEVTNLVSGNTSVNITVTAIGSPPLAKSLVGALSVHCKHRVSLSQVATTTTEKQGPAEERSKQSKIAIVGMSGRFPDATNVNELWDLLLQGLDVHKQIPPDRFDVATHVDPTRKRKNTSATPYGCFINKPGLFDPAFFQMSPREAKNTDPMQRLALVCAYEALESAGYVPDRTPASMRNRAGVFLGQTLDDYREVNAAQDIDPFYVSGCLRPFGPGRISYYYKFTGPSYVIDTACSSSLAAIHTACGALRSGECDMAVAGGTNIITGSDMYAGLSRGQFLSETGSCKTFDDGADGYCRADAVATLVLKRLEDAEADNDPILGLILGSATNHSSQATSITQPHGPTQEALFRTVLDQAGVEPRGVDCVEMHGTGTQIGDSTEMHSVANVFGDRGRDAPLYVGSIKGNLGHSEAAAGVTSVIKGLLMFQHNAIPAHVGVKDKPNRHFPPLEDYRVRILREAVAFPRRSGRKRRMLVNNFGAAGGNTVMVLEEPPAKDSAAKAVAERPAYLVAVSGKTIASLQANKDRLSSFLRRNTSISLADLSYTLTSRRPHYRHRFIVAADSMSSLQQALDAPQETTLTEKPRLVIAFTGQGAVYSGLARAIFSVSHHFRSDLLRFDQLAINQDLPSFLPLLDPSTDLSSLSAAQVQLGQVCVQMALYRLYRSWGIVPSAVVGHSLGEYAALYAAGVLTASDTILIVGIRAMLVEQHCAPGTHTMLAVRAPPKTIMDLTAGIALDIACINGPDDVVLGGTVEAINSAAKTLSSTGIKLTRLPVPYAYHSSQLDPVTAPFEHAARRVEFYTPTIPVLSPLLGHDITSSGVVSASYLSRHLRQKVDFPLALWGSAFLSTDSDTQFLELGPHPVCAGMIASVLGKTAIPSLCRGEDAWKSALAGLAALYLRGFDVDWEEHNRDMDASVSCLGGLPGYAFEEKDYWIEYRGDWALSKGDAKTSPWVSEVMVPRGPATASVQRLVCERLDEQPVSAEFETDLRRPDICNAITGHVVDGVALCPSAVFADMAFTAARYLFEKTIDGFNETSMELLDLDIVSPVVLELSEDHARDIPRLVRISAMFTSEETCYIEVSHENTTAGSNPTSVLYARCTVALRPASKVHAKRRRNKHLIASRIAHLRSDPAINRLNSRIAYKMFRAVVDYSKPYQGMDEILLSGEHYEAVAQVSFKDDPATGGSFFRSPYWLDNVAQLSGFVLNANETVDSSVLAYISNGWESMHILAPLSRQQAYTVYVKMEPGERSAVSGDVYVLDEAGEIVCATEGIKFQGIPRPLLKLLLQPKTSTPLHQGVPAADPAPDSKSQSSGQQLSVSPGTTPGNSASSSYSANTEPSTPSDSTDGDVVQLVLRILCEEVGIELHTLDRSLKFADLGVDSIMSLTIAGRLRENHNLDLPSIMFQSHPTVHQLTTYLTSSTLPAIPPRHPAKPSQPPATPAVHHGSTSVLLQGTPQTTTHALFLFPGGFGTASTFAPLPPLSPSLAVYGLNSPFLSNPSQFTVTIPQIAALYLAEIRRRQPLGPYSFMGYSVGGIIAYEAARQVIVSGGEVERLYLVDSPCPLVIPPMPPALIKFLDSIDRFGSREKKEKKDAEAAAKPMGSLHVTQTLISLQGYVPEALPSGASCPRTTYYIAKQGVLDPQATVQRPDVPANEQKVISWLLDDRVGLGGTGDGWEVLLGSEKLKIVAVEGNHFSIMKEPWILEWTEELRSSYWD